MPRTSTKAREAEFREAVLDLVAERGYDRVTMDEVASKTQASKTTLYRRWPSKAAFVVDALRQREALSSEPADTGDLRDDLVDMLTKIADGLAEDIGMAISLLAAAQRDPELMATLRETVRKPRVELGRLPLGRAIERGELNRQVDTLLADRIASPLLLHRAIWDDGPLDRTFVEAMVDEIIMPLLERYRVSD